MIASVEIHVFLSVSFELIDAVMLSIIRAVKLSFFRVRSVIGRLFKNSVGYRLSVGYL